MLAIVGTYGVDGYVPVAAPTTQAAPPPAVQQGGGPTMDDAIAAGDGTLHGAIDHWQRRALDAERVLLSRGLVLEEAAKACEERERRANREDVRATCRLCAKDIRSLAVVNQSLTTGPTTHPAAPVAQRDVREETSIGKAVNRAARDLPEGWEIRIDLERHAGVVHLIDPEGNETMIEGNGELFSDQISAAIDAASSQSKEGA